ncbi:MAG: L,D-transpeptidase [Anaerolineales bacterium]|nr:L,D-transpeptidase [Anaerolineales bacterium]
MTTLSRRGFLKAGLGGAGAWMLPAPPLLAQSEFPDSPRLGRVVSGQVAVRAQPDYDSPEVGQLYDDAVVPWLAEVAGSYRWSVNQRWVETEGGYVWASRLQPVLNLPNIPVSSLRETSLGPGMWAEVTVPYVDLSLDNPPARSPYLRQAAHPRLYYSQVVWIDQVQSEGESVQYRVNERYGYGDLLLAEASAFRPLTDDELAPISPDVEEKRVIVDLLRQTLSCFEGRSEVYYCRISSGAKFDAEGNPVDKWSTPLGPHPIWRKLISTHMSGGSTATGYDLPGVAWTSLFSGDGVAIHSTFWHNNFGEPMSHGCVNARPEDAKWVFRWSRPHVPYDPGDGTVEMPGGTIVEVVEG